jgi:hypothetical protein
MTFILIYLILGFSFLYFIDRKYGSEIREMCYTELYDDSPLTTEDEADGMSRALHIVIYLIMAISWPYWLYLILKDLLLKP